VNLTAPHLMAMACGDPYVRLFDRPRTCALVLLECLLCIVGVIAAKALG
jgi:hypothetical protein